MIRKRIEAEEKVNPGAPLNREIDSGGRVGSMPCEGYRTDQVFPDAAQLGAGGSFSPIRFGGAQMRQDIPVPFDGSVNATEALRPLHHRVHARILVKFGMSELSEFG